MQTCPNCPEKTKSKMIKFTYLRQPLVGILIWCFSMLFTVKYWARFILNISLLFYLSDKKKKGEKTN